jgi:Flp pilus assembly protein TadG
VSHHQLPRHPLSLHALSLHGASGPRTADRGSVTAETAVVLPVLFLVLLAAMTGIRAGATELACQDAARAGARAAARGETASTVVATARRVAPPGATVNLGHEGGLVRVTVRAQVQALGGLRLPTFGVGGDAVAEPEQGS